MAHVTPEDEQIWASIIEQMKQDGLLDGPKPKPKCECGGKKLRLPHSRWCPANDLETPKG